jgi:hypothetical protein
MVPGKGRVNMTFAVKVRFFNATPVPVHTGMVVPATSPALHWTLVVIDWVPSNEGDAVLG